jgi:putative oxidoreductase
VTRKSDAARTKSISNEANDQTLSWTIGSKPNVNSNKGRFSERSLQIAAAGMFLMVGFLKLSGNAQLVGLFEAIGFGQWFRYLTGTLEVAGAILLLIPRTSGLGALMLAGVMAGAVMTRLFVVGGSPLMAIILLAVTTVVAWGRRQRTKDLLVGLQQR